MIKGLKSKIILMIIMIGIILMPCSQVFASENEYNFTGIDGEEYTVPLFPESDFEHSFIVKDDDGTLFLFLFSGSLTVSGYSGAGTRFQFSSKDSYSYYSLTDGSWFKYGNSGEYGLIDCTVLVSCNDLLKDLERINNIKGEEAESFFFNPKVPVGTGILAPVVEPTGMETTLQEIIQLLPMIMLILVGLIGLRKALAFLLTFLRQS